MLNSPSLIDSLVSGQAANEDRLLRGVDGLHFKETHLLSMPASTLEFCKRRALKASLSTHDPESYLRCKELLSAAGLAPCFALAGTCYMTGSHPEKRWADCRGLELVAELSKTSDDDKCDMVAIGGITRDRLGEVLGRGADGVAVLSGWIEDRGEWGEYLRSRERETNS